MANGVIVSFVARRLGGDATAVPPRAGAGKGARGGRWCKSAIANTILKNGILSA